MRQAELSDLDAAGCIDGIFADPTRYEVGDGVIAEPEFVRKKWHR